MAGSCPSIPLPWRGQCIHGAGAEGGRGRGYLGGFAQVSDLPDGHLLPVSHFPLCPLPSEGNPCFSEANPSSPTGSRIGLNTSIADGEEITSSRYGPWTFSRTYLLFLTFPFVQTPRAVFSPVSKGSKK